MAKKTKPRLHCKTWGYHGSERLVRDERGLIVMTSNHFEAFRAGNGSSRCKQKAREMVFSGGPECTEYNADTISDEDRERLEREIGAPFARGKTV